MVLLVNFPTQLHLCYEYLWKTRSAYSSENVLLPITKSGLKGYVLKVQYGLMSILLFHVFLCFVGFQFSLEEFRRL